MSFVKNIKNKIGNKKYCKISCKKILKIKFDVKSHVQKETLETKFNIKNIVKILYKKIKINLV